MREKYEKFRIYQNYILVFVMSLICLFVMPFMGSKIGLTFKCPNTAAGWVVFSVCNITTAILSLMIFHCFVRQAKVNVRDNPKYLEAQEILQDLKLNKFVPRDPHTFLKQQYRTKGTMLFISSITAMIGLSNAVLTFDLAILLSFVAVVISSVVFGILEMNVVEDYWTDEYYIYAKQIQKESEEKSLNDQERRWSDTPELAGTSPAE